MGRQLGAVQQSLRRWLSTLSAERLAKDRWSRKRTRPEVMVGIITDDVKTLLRTENIPDLTSKPSALRNLRIRYEKIYQHYKHVSTTSGQDTLHAASQPRNNSTLQQRNGTARPLNIR